MVERDDGHKAGYLDEGPYLYEHEPLETNETIRLLKLEPRKDGNHEVSCTICTTSFYDEDRLNYVALSYTWGNPVSTHNAATWADKQYWIRCDGKRLKVGENLYHALLRLHNLGFKCPFWIDAICINQEHPEEHSSQVAITGKIYAQAALVIAWLGEEDYDSRIALPLIAQLMEACFRDCDYDFGKLVAKINNFAVNDPRFYAQVGIAHGSRYLDSSLEVGSAGSGLFKR
ncbi:hypothetical protein MMC30_003261 [Trapelia coarctata]|nr:hypothetical protein [Trapelia coarctata]